MKINHFSFQYWNQKKIYLAHDAEEKCKEGDLVLIKQCRKLSKQKWYQVIDIVEPASGSLVEQAKKVEGIST